MPSPDRIKILSQLELACERGEKFKVCKILKKNNIILEKDIANLFVDACFLGLPTLAMWLFNVSKQDINFEGAFIGAFANNKLFMVKWLLSVR
ncbi:MAG: hypothetical protein Harvfovirus70_2 [Harvfovirus sp.]|uniref:Ankyrin repeat protein n=1 Tax=Harvfovirus sp. TaxID=2487768 RepID=A0A3G5A3Q0_9VIRU|nr:MAG: hypothetical protein Harvfovirus70_2 [Harvfovirus sp.]